MRGRPDWGYSVSLGLGQVGYKGPTGNITGAMATLRLHERFGDLQQQLFGLSAAIFYSASLLSTVQLGAYYSQNLSQPSLHRPELWVYGEIGGLVSAISAVGRQGNSFYLESGVDLHLKWRLSLAAGVQYVLPTRFANYDLGGIGFRLRVALNW